MQCHLRSILACFALSSTTFAQSFNIDVGNPTSVPSPTFGAAAHQAGVWNQFGALPTGGSAVLVDLSGAGTSVQVTLSAGASPTLFHFDNIGTTGEDELLMDDGARSSVGSTTYTFSGLAAGMYAVYVYAWAPDNASLYSRVTVNGTAFSVGGPWPGSFQEVFTHLRLNVQIPAGGDLTITLTGVLGLTTLNGLQIFGVLTPSTTFCTGDLVGTTCLGCGNNGAPGRGCANSVFAGGGLLTTVGTASIGNDSLSLLITDMPSSTTFFFQANGLASSPDLYGDGMLCASVGIARLGAVFATAGLGAYPGGLTPNPLHLAGGLINPGDIRHYQCWYRDTAPFCAPASFNMTNGVTLAWSP